jgi:hypothetical protein
MSPGSESTACLEGFIVNVGSPNRSSWMKYWWTSVQARKPKWGLGSQKSHSTCEAVNYCGGKDSRLNHS